jgi:hypothetical protein
MLGEDPSPSRLDLTLVALGNARHPRVLEDVTAISCDLPREMEEIFAGVELGLAIEARRGREVVREIGLRD